MSCPATSRRGGSIPDIIEFGSDVYYSVEGDKECNVEVVRLGDAQGWAQASYHTLDGSAKAGTKYVAKSGVVDFAQGETRKKIPIQILDNALFESVLEFEIEMTSCTGAVLGIYLNKCKVILDDNDFFPTNAVKRHLQQLDDVTDMPSWILLYSYLWMNLADKRFLRDSVLVVLVDQLGNLKCIVDIYVCRYLMDYLAQSVGTGDKAKDRLWWDVGILVSCALIVLPQVVVAIMEWLKVRLDIRTRAIDLVEANLLRKFLYYDDTSHRHASASDMTMAAVRYVPDMVDLALSGSFYVVRQIGLLFMLLISLAHCARQSTIDFLIFVIASGMLVPVLTTSVLWLQNRRMKSLRRAASGAETRVIRVIQMCADSYRFFFDYSHQTLLVDIFTEAIDTFSRQVRMLRQSEVMSTYVASFLINLVVSFSILCWHHRGWGDEITIGSLVGIILCLQAMGGACGTICDGFFTIHRGLAPLENVAFLMNEPVVIRRRQERHEHLLREEGEKLGLAASMSSSRRALSLGQANDMMSIRASGLSFSYSPAGASERQFILDDASFEIPQGNLVAIVGPRSCGKATLVKLIGGVILPPPETLFIPPHLRILHVSTHVYLVEHLSLFENVCLGLPDTKGCDVDMGRALAICKRLRLSEAVLRQMEADFSSCVARGSLSLSLLESESPSRQPSRLLAECPAAVQAMQVADFASKRRLKSDEKTLVLTESDKLLLNIARALVRDPELLVMHTPFYRFDGVHQRLVLATLREFVDKRGVEQSTRQINEPRLRTCIVSMLSESHLARVADIALRLESGKVTQIQGVTFDGMLETLVSKLMSGGGRQGWVKLNLEQWLDVAARAPNVAELLGLPPQFLDSSRDAVEFLTDVFRQVDLDGSGDIDLQGLVLHIKQALGTRAQFVVRALFHEDRQVEASRVFGDQNPRKQRRHDHRRTKCFNSCLGAVNLSHKHASSEAPPRVLVSNPCMRGITLGDLMDFFESYCGSISFEDTKTGMKPVCLPTMLAQQCIAWNMENSELIRRKECRDLQPNLYGVNTLFILPHTNMNRVSYSELLHPDGALISIFISHYWGEDFGEFCQSTFRYALSRASKQFPDLPETELYPRVRDLTFYICAFSNNQWNLAEEMGTSTEESPFYKILQAKTTKEVVMNMDSQASALLRAWCCFEFLLTHQQEKPFVLNSRFGPVQELDSEDWVLEQWVMHVFWVLQVVDIRRAQASEESDLKTILDHISTFKGTCVAEGLTGAEALNQIIKSLVSNQVLHIFSKLGRAKEIKIALQAGADCQRLDQHGLPALTYCSALPGESQERRLCVDLLLSSRADCGGQAHASTVVGMFHSDAQKREAAIRLTKQMDEASRELYSEAIRLAEGLHNSRVAKDRLYNLRSGNSDHRLTVLEAIAGMECVDAQYVTGIANCLADKDDRVRFFAAFAMSKAGAEALPYADVLERGARDPDHPGVALMMERAISILRPRRPETSDFLAAGPREYSNNEVVDALQQPPSEEASLPALGDGEDDGPIFPPVFVALPADRTWQ